MSVPENPPAFPLHSAQKNGLLEPTNKGMTLRDYFAGRALPTALDTDYGLDWGRNNIGYPSCAAKRAYQIADAMLAERDRVAALGGGSEVSELVERLRKTIKPGMGNSWDDPDPTHDLRAETADHIERVEEELEELRQNEEALNKLALRFQDERDNLQAEVKVLREALKPFADYAEFFNDCEAHPNGCPDDAQAGEIVDLTVGDFRRARSTLSSTGEG